MFLLLTTIATHTGQSCNESVSVLLQYALDLDTDPPTHPLSLTFFVFSLYTYNIDYT